MPKKAADPGPPTNGTCKFCGQGVRWMIRPGGSRIPLDYLGNVYTSDAQMIAHGPSWGFLRHTCKPELLDEYQAKQEAQSIQRQRLNERQAALRALERQQRKHYMEKAPLIAAAHKEHLAMCIRDYDCPKCGVPKGTECANLIDVKKVGIEFAARTKQPHAERGPEWVVPKHLQYQEPL